MISATPTLIVYEQTGQWASAIRRVLSPPAEPSVRRAPEEADLLAEPIESGERRPAARVEKTGAARRASAMIPNDGKVAPKRQIVECRAADHCLRELAQASVALVALELRAESRERSLELLATIAEIYPTVPVVVLAERRLRRYEWLARELGAVHFIVSPQRLGQLATIAHRHWERTGNMGEADSAQSPDLPGVIDGIWESLP